MMWTHREGEERRAQDRREKARRRGKEKERTASTGLHVGAQ